MPPHRPSTDPFQDALRAYQAGRPKDAAAKARRLTRQAPDRPDPWVLLMAAERSQGRVAAALEAGHAGRRRHPKHGPLLANLGIIAAESGRFADAESAFRAALEQTPDDPNLTASLAKVLLSREQPDTALSVLADALARHDGDAELHFVAGNAALAQGDLAAAVAAYERAVARSAGHGAAWANLGATRQRRGDASGAEAACREAVALMPKSAFAWNNLGNVLAAQDRAAEAESAYRSALSHDSTRLETLTNLGHVLRDLGRFDEARACYRDALARQSHSGEAWVGLAAITRFEADGPDLAAMTTALNADGLSDGDRLRLHYALARSYARLGDYAGTAFGHYAEGARLKRRTLGYDVARGEAALSALADQGAPASLTRGSEAETRPAPVFIVGMPRSGTTLVEQILASHPQVLAGGEQPALGRAVREMCQKRDVTLVGLLASFDEAAAETLAHAYRVGLTLDISDEPPFVTDKMPTNFRYLGFIRAAFPHARIVHVRRHPLDTCLSCFTRLFNHDSQPFSYDLDELGRYYIAYADFMAKLTPAIPAGQYREVHYENLVTDFETTVAALLAFCNLPWADACRDFHRTDRVVRTASATQVRQPLYTSAIGTWRSYADQLTPLRARFEAAGLLDGDGEEIGAA